MRSRIELKVCALAAVLVLVTGAAGAAMAVKVLPDDRLDVEEGSVPEDPETWYAGNWSVDTLGADFTYGTTPDPLAENVTGLRDAALNNASTDQLIPLLQARQRGWMSGNLTISAPVNSTQQLAFSIQPGDGWFASLDRDPGDDQNGASVDWEARTVDEREEKAVLHWSGCGHDDEYDLLGDMGNPSEELDRFAHGGGHDAKMPDGVTVHRHDIASFSFTPVRGCQFNVTLEFAFEFVHEVFAAMPPDRAAVGYQPADIVFSMCRWGWVADRGHGCMGETHDIVLETEVFFLPVFPLGEAIKMGCGSEQQLLECIRNQVANTPAGTYGSTGLVWDGSEFVALATDKHVSGLADVRVFHLKSLTFDEATGSEQHMFFL